MATFPGNRQVEDRCLVFVADDAVYSKVTHTKGGVRFRAPRLNWQDEDSFWELDFTLYNPTGGFYRPGPNQRVFLSEKIAGQWELVFDGRMKVPPYGIKGHLVDIHCEARPKIVKIYNQSSDVVGVLQDQHTIARQAICGETVGVVDGKYGSIYRPGNAFDDDPWLLFTDLNKVYPFDTRKAEEILSARAMKLHWPRTGGMPKPVDIIFGDGTNIDLGAKFVAGSFKFDQKQTPITRVDVTIDASWDQRILRGARIEDAAQNADAVVGTLSPGDWSSFPRPGAKVGDWTVTRSGINRVGPPAGENQYSKNYSVSTSANTPMVQTSETTRQVSFTRSFFDFDLELQGIQSFRRTETLTFSVFWGGQTVAGFDGETDTVDLTCRNLRNDQLYPEFQPGVFLNGNVYVRFDGLLWRTKRQLVTGSSVYEDIDDWDPVLVDGSPVGSPQAAIFFGAEKEISASMPGNNGEVAIVVRKTIPGLTAIAYAYRQAVAKIADSVSIPASFQVPWEWVRTITGRETITLKPQDMNGQSVTGKIKSISVDLSRGIATISIGTVPGAGKDSIGPGKPQYGGDLIPYAGIIGFDILNDYLQQEAALDTLPSPITQNIEQVLSQLATQWSLRMTPIAGASERSRNIDLGNYVYYGPKQIDIGDNT